MKITKLNNVETIYSFNDGESYKISRSRDGLFNIHSQDGIIPISRFKDLLYLKKETYNKLSLIFKEEKLCY